MARTEPDVDDDRGDDDVTAGLAKRVARALDRSCDVDDLLATGLRGKDLTTLLLHAQRTRARGRSFVDVVEQSERMGLFHPCDLDGRLLHRLDSAAFDAAAGFDVVDLSPALPLGAVSQTGIDPNNVLTAVRFAELAADPSVAFALHAARRRRRDKTDGADVKLCASLRCVRLQPPKSPGHKPHFRMCALGSAVRGDDADVVERGALHDQLAVWLRFFTKEHAPRMKRLRLSISDTRIVTTWLRSHDLDARVLSDVSVGGDHGASWVKDAGVVVDDFVDDCGAEGLGGVEAVVDGLHNQVVRPLRAAFPHVEIGFSRCRLRGLRYYRGPMIDLSIERDDGLVINIGDGGATNWLQMLVGQKRERFIATGIGIELIARLFQRSPAEPHPPSSAAS